MSAPLTPEGVRFLQRTLCAAGCYSGPQDGVWSSAVDEAEVKLGSLAEQIAATHGRFDPRSEQNISTLHPTAQAAARRLLANLRAAGIEAKVISGTRTYEEQETLFRQGRTDPGKIVTNARGGHSNHNFGIAWDIGIFKAGQYSRDVRDYEDAARHIPAGVEWGGAWKKFPDPPHYQLAVGLALADVRTRFESGQAFVSA
jgi:peptidoglycan L-alanyl-D-glutamate endopeptidase CwlK